MPKRTILILSVVLGIIFLILLGYYLLAPGQEGTTGGIGIFKNFFPFGGDENPSGNNGGNGGEGGGGEGGPVVENPQIESPQAKLRLLSAEPVSGAGVIDAKAGTLVRYIEKATGHIFEVEMFSPNKTRISNTTFPLVYDAIWGNKNNSLMVRYLKDDDQTVETYSLNIKVGTSTENNVSGIIFPGNLGDVSVFDTSVFYLENGNGFSSGFTSGFDGKNKKQVWNSPIKEILSQYVNSKTVALTTKPREGVLGFMYFIDPTTGVSKNILANVLGLSTITSPDASQVLYLEQSGKTKFSLLDVKTKNSVTQNPITFPEKCVWSKKDKTVVYCAVPEDYLNSSSLTSWYMGLSSFTDDIWKYDLKKNTSSILFSLEEKSGRKIDVLKPILSDNEQYLVFMNKVDNTLWSLDLTK